MKKLLFVFVGFLLIDYSNAQQIESGISGFIDISKKAAVPVIAHDFSWADTIFSFGTAVILGEGNSACAVTCEHVIAIKDTNQKTIKYISNIWVQLNLINDSSIIIPTTIVYNDEKNDFAILSLPKDIVINYSIHLKLIPPSQVLERNKLKEGLPIFYIGYPFSWGIGKKNYPVSRIGIISQLIDNNNIFLIDGFTQIGYSGSPVFTYDITGNRYLIGIIKGYPNDIAEIYQEVKFAKDIKRIAIVNPGFTIVTPMDEILKEFNKLRQKK